MLGSVRSTQDELESRPAPRAAVSLLLMGLGDESHSGMLGWRGQAGQAGQSSDATALTVSDNGGEPLDEDQGMENKGGAAGGYP